MNTKLAVQSPGAFHFSLGGHPVRVAVANPDGTPAWLVAADVIQALGLTGDGSQLVRGMEDVLHSMQDVPDSVGRKQPTVCVSMEGVIVASARARGEVGAQARKALAAGMVQAAQQVAAPAVPPELAGRLDRVLAILEPRAESKVARVHRQAVQLGLLPADSVPPAPPLRATPPPAPTKEQKTATLLDEVVEFLRTAAHPHGADAIAVKLGRAKVNVRAAVKALAVRGLVEQARRGRSTGWALTGVTSPHGDA